MEPQLETSFATWWAGKSPMLGRELGDWVAEKIAQTLQGPPVKDEDK
jgi:hypothetical protein